MEEIKIYSECECVLKTDKEIIVELPNTILKIKGDYIETQNKRNNSKLDYFVCRPKE
jgi:hypothetical protein